MEFAKVSFARGSGGTLGGSLPVLDLVGEFVEQAVLLFGRPVGIKLCFDGRLDLARAPPAVFSPAAVRPVR